MGYAGLSLDGLVAFVTGSGRGIGKALALGLAQAGADVVVSDLPQRMDEAREVQREIEGMGRRSNASLLDVRDIAAVRSVGVRFATVHLEALQHLPAQGGLGKHSLDRVLDYSLRVTLQHLGQGGGAQATGIAGVTVVHSLRALASGDLYSGGVDHHHVIPRDDVGRIDGLVLALENSGHLGGKTAQDLARGIYHVPAGLDIHRSGAKARYSTHGRHVTCSAFEVEGPT